MPRLLHTGAGPNLVNNLFLPHNWRSGVESVKAQPLRPTSEYAVPVQCFLSVNLFMEYLLARALSSNMEIFAVEIITWTSYINRCICGILVFERKIVPIDSHMMTIPLSLPKGMSLFGEKVGDGAIGNGSGILEMFPFRIERSTIVQLCTKAPNTAFSITVLSLIESRRDIVEKHKSMVALWTIAIFPGLPFRKYVAYISPKVVQFTKNMVFS